MITLVLAVVPLIPTPADVAGEKPIDPPWAKVTLNAERGGKPDKEDPAISGGMSAGPGVSGMNWHGPTPPGAKRHSATSIKPDGAFAITILKLSKGLWLTVWMEPDEEWLAAVKEKSVKMGHIKEGGADPETLRSLRSEAIVTQRNYLDAEARGALKEPLRIIFRGEVAAPEKDRLVPSLPSVGRITTQARIKKDVAVPLPGEAWVEGRLEAGKYDVGGGKASAWAIRNGTSPIALVGKGAEVAGDLKGDVRAVGRLRVGPDRQLLLEVDELKSLKK